MVGVLGATCLHLSINPILEIKHVLKKKEKNGLERQLSCQEYLLFLQRTQV